MYGLGNIDLQKYNPFPSFQSGQAEAIAQILGHFENGQKVVELNAPTAAGKSLDLFVLGRILSEKMGVRVVYEDRRRKPMIFSRGMNPYTPRKPYILSMRIMS